MDGIEMCAVAMQDAQRRLETATVELSNAETDGFTQHVGGRPIAATHQPLRSTGRPLDFVVSGPGALHVAPVSGSGKLHDERAVRAGSFHRDDSGYLVDGAGRALLGTTGPLHVPPDAQFRADGSIVSSGSVVAHIALARGAELHSGFTIGSNVNAIGEMVEILDAQRSFETAEKTLSAVDAARQKATGDVGKMQ